MTAASEYLGHEVEVVTVDMFEWGETCAKCGNDITKRTFARIDGKGRWQTVVNTCSEHVTFAEARAWVLAEALIERES